MTATRAPARRQAHPAKHDAFVSAQMLGRAGLVARAVFYGLLAYLAARIAALGGSRHQADAAGALAIVSGTMIGKVAVAVAAAGFLTFGLVRITAAVRDHRPQRWRRLTTAAQGVCYVLLTYVPVSFLAGNHRSGSEAAQHSATAALLGLPGGGAAVVAIGVVVLSVSAWQIRTAVREDYTAGMRQPKAAWLRSALRVVGTAGIAARALVFGPIGAFLIWSGVSEQPSHSKGLDGELEVLARSNWGRPVLVAVTVGLLVFAGYSLLEAHYRNLGSGR